MAIAIEWASVERTSNGLGGPSMTTVILSSDPTGDVDPAWTEPTERQWACDQRRP